MGNNAATAIWIGKQPEPDAEPPKLVSRKGMEQAASLATVFGTLVVIMGSIIGGYVAGSLRLGILEDHDKATQEKVRYYDGLVIERTRDIADIKNDIKWLVETQKRQDKSGK